MATSKTIKGWYSNEDPSCSSHLILRTAYEEAVSIVSKELEQDKQRLAWLRSEQSMEDFRQAILDAQTKYQAKANSKARKWLGILLSKVMYYAPVLDVLSQTGQQYSSLAWGIMKFLLMAVVNNEEMVSQLSKACSYIGDILPRTDLALILYPTEMMKEAVARLYAQILKFMQHAVCWYRQGKLVHAWTAVAKPWALSFKDCVEAIGQQAQQVDRLASSASKAELRDMHIEICETREELRQVRAHVYQLLHMAQTTHSIHAQMQLDVSASKEMICNIQLAQILSLPFMSNLPTSGESLEYCQSLRRRQRDKPKLSLPDKSLLQQWATQSQTSFLITESSSHQAAKCFLVDLLYMISTAQFPVLWALRFADFSEKDISCADIIRILLLQAIQINPRALSHSSYPITVTHLREAVNEADWLALLCRALEGIPHVYVAIDADLLGHATGHNRYLATRWIEAIPKAVNNTALSVFVSALGVDVDYARRNWDPESWSKIRTDHVEGRHQRRKMLHRRR